MALKGITKACRFKDTAKARRTVCLASATGEQFLSVALPRECRTKKSAEESTRQQNANEQSRQE